MFDLLYIEYTNFSEKDYLNKGQNCECSKLYAHIFLAAYTI